MKPNCRNDCLEPTAFPRKIINRPGLSHIDYRIGTYSDIREALLRNLNKNVLLAEWTHRGPDDPGIALLEGASILGDILTFYQELYVNEAYLRTAQWRDSIADLVKLLGYRLSPGLGGKATFAFEVKGDKPVIIPKRFPIKAQVKGVEQPVDFETVKEFIAIPSLSKFYLYRPTHIPKFSGEVSVFSIKTSDLEQAGLRINEKDRLMLLDYSPTNNAQIVIVKKVEQQFDRTNITIYGSWKKGRGVGQIKAYKLGRTFRHFGHNAPPEVIKLDATPSQKPIMYNRNLSNDTSTTGDTTISPSFTSKEIPLDMEVEDLITGSNIIIQGLTSNIPSVLTSNIPSVLTSNIPSVLTSNIPSVLIKSLEFEVGSVKPMKGGRIFPDTKIAISGDTIVRKIEGFRSSSMTWGSLSGATTIITIDKDMDTKRLTADIRNLVIHETVGNALILENARQIGTSANGKCLDFYGERVSYEQLDRRFIQLVGNNQTEQTMVTINRSSLGTTNELTLRPLTLNPELQLFSLDDFPLDNPTVTVYGNLVDATQGKTEKEAVLGNGDNRQTFQTFKLPKAPLTYYNSAGETPPEVPELQIYVNDRLWKRVSSFFGHGPKEEIYIVREDERGDSYVQFGDGKTGSRLPSGIKNVVARYRTGTGAHGALKENTTVQSGGKLDRLDKIQLPGVVSGGSEPETGENAREAAPGKVQSLNRLVSLKDFESEALAISGVSKVKSTWDLVDNTSAVILTVLMETGRDKEINAVQSILNNYNRCRGPQRFPIIVAQGKLQYVYVDAEFGLHPAFREDVVEKAIKEALGVSGEEGKGNGINGERGLFGLSQRQFGQDEYATKIEGVIQNVEGVVWAKVKAFGFLGESEDPSKISLPLEPKPLNLIVSCDNLHILSLYKAHLQLKASKAESKEVC